MTPTLKEQMEWLDLIKGLLHSDNAPMILAIKENLIAVRNIEMAIDIELAPLAPHIDQAMKDLFERGEATIDYKALGLSTEKPLLQFFEVDPDTGDTVHFDREATMKAELDSYMKQSHLDQIVTTIESIERYNENNPEKPFEFRSEFLNDRERNVLKSRISKLQEEIQFQYQLPKVLRRPRGIKEAQERIATLKKWLDESTLDR